MESRVNKEVSIDLSYEQFKQIHKILVPTGSLLKIEKLCNRKDCRAFVFIGITYLGIS